MLDEFCFKSKNLYNFANYIIRQSYIKENKYTSYYDMEKVTKLKGEDFDYRALPSVAIAQQCLMKLDKNWKSFFKATKSWQTNPSKFLGKPNIPKYLEKNGRNLIILPRDNSTKIRDGYITFPKKFNGLKIKTALNDFRQVRILPRNNQIIVEVIYQINVKEQKMFNDKILSIDIGVDNLATVANNFGAKSIIVNGKPLKSINQYYNKKVSHIQSVSKQMNGMNYTKKLYKLTNKRQNKIENQLHKASKSIIDYALSYDVSTIVIGNNQRWKQKINIGRKVNQKFVGIPHQKLIEMIQYKAENVGVTVILTEESYTSGTSFLDGEMPVKENYNKSRRVNRGLFVSNEGIKINADVNGAYQIMKKVFPNVFRDGIEGVDLYPFRVTV